MTNDMTFTWPKAARSGASTPTPASRAASPSCNARLVGWGRFRGRMGFTPKTPPTTEQELSPSPDAGGPLPSAI